MSGRYPALTDGRGETQSLTPRFKSHFWTGNPLCNALPWRRGGKEGGGVSLDYWLVNDDSHNLEDGLPRWLHLGNHHRKYIFCRWLQNLYIYECGGGLDWKRCQLPSLFSWTLTTSQNWRTKLVELNEPQKTHQQKTGHHHDVNFASRSHVHRTSFLLALGENYTSKNAPCYLGGLLSNQWHRNSPSRCVPLTSVVATEALSSAPRLTFDLYKT